MYLYVFGFWAFGSCGFLQVFELILHAMLASLICIHWASLGVQLNIPGLLGLSIPLAFLVSVS